MTDALEVQLSTLRQASDQLLHSTLQIGDSAAAIRAVLRELVALGYDAGGSFHLALNTDFEPQLETLARLKTQLDGTVYAVENAMIAHFPPLGALLNPSPLTYLLGSVRSAPELVPVAVFDPDRYVSATNRALYDDLRTNRDALAHEQTRLQTLIAQRAGLVEDLRALRNRDLSDPGGSAELQAQIQRIDGEIVRSQGEIERLHGQVETLTARLERVAPGLGANLAEIRQLEIGESSEAIKRYTEGCVNYIVHRIHIPPVLAHDAHLWNDIAAQNPQYGITQGSEPLPGSVLVMEREHSYADDLYGHVMYVERVDGDTVWVTDNLHAEPVKLADLTSETTGANITYLYLPWHTSA